MGIPRDTIRNWIIKCKNGEDFYTDHRSLGYGRPRVANIDYKEKYMLFKKETLHNNDYQTISEYVNGVFDWIWF